MTESSWSASLRTGQFKRQRRVNRGSDVRTRRSIVRSLSLLPLPSPTDTHPFLAVWPLLIPHPHASSAYSSAVFTSRYSPLEDHYRIPYYSSQESEDLRSQYLANRTRIAHGAVEQYQLDYTVPPPYPAPPTTLLSRLCSFLTRSRAPRQSSVAKEAQEQVRKGGTNSVAAVADFSSPPFPLGV
jgi:hypothetical protein